MPETPYAKRCVGVAREEKRQRDRERRARYRQEREALEVLRALLCPGKKKAR